MLDKSSQANFSKNALENWQNKVQTDKNLAFPFNWKNIKNKQAETVDLADKTAAVSLNLEEPVDSTVNNDKIEYITLSASGNGKKTKLENDNFKQMPPLSTRGIRIFEKIQ